MKKKVAIVGAGAIGLYYGARLAKAGAEVHFILRSDYDAVCENGITVESVAGDFQLAADEVLAARSAAEVGPVDLVIIAWKATANEHYESAVSPLIGENTNILTLQNGLGNVEDLAKLFGAQRILGGLCFVCINRLSPGHVRHTASGKIVIGEFQPAGNDRLADWLEFLTAAEIDAQPADNLEYAQWAKLVWNIPFNGLAIAEGGVDTEQLLANPEVERKVRALMAEVQAVAAALGHQISDRFLEKQIEVTRPMGPYRPSSMIDYVEGRAVELDAIWTNPLRIAQQLGVAVPEMEALHGRIVQRLRSSNS
ncbi:2-dehydropantoate 2-reductase [Persicirhabdus sediminis]|nr:2-dehydropantoate 2-reductase [Persicirhabdus sediminis]